jgi:hypothetical protein
MAFPGRWNGEGEESDWTRFRILMLSSNDFLHTIIQRNE